MQKLSLISILVLLTIGMMHAPAALADSDASMVVEIDQGTTEFELYGENFRITTPQRLTIAFAGISTERVWGRLILEADSNIGVINFIWLKTVLESQTLHSGTISEHEIPFDSEDEVTGHNEK